MTHPSLKSFSAWLPIAMSLAALTLVLGHVLLSGIAPQPDEGAAAHLWQFLMAGQVPAIAFFALKWLHADRKFALAVLALQIGLAIVAAVPVLLLHW